MAQTTVSLDVFTDTLTKKRYVTDVFGYISPHDAPLWSYLGGANAASKFNIVNLPGDSIQWIEDELRALTSTLSASCTSDTNTVSVNDGEYFRVGDLIEIGTETLWVSAVSSDDLTVTRGWGSTTGATADSDTSVERVSIAQVDGMAYAASQQVTKTTVNNYVQIFEDTALVTYLRDRISLHGASGELDIQVGKLIPEMMRNLEKTVFRGLSSAGANSQAPSMNGLGAMITDNTSSATGTALTEKLLHDAMYAAYADGGNPRLIVTNQWGARKINSFYEAPVRTTIDEHRGGITINHVISPFGECDVLMDRWCPATSMFLIDTDHIGIYPFQDWTEEPITQSGMTIARRVWGAYSLVLKHDKAHALVYYSSTT